MICDPVQRFEDRRDVGNLYILDLAEPINFNSVGVPI